MKDLKQLEEQYKLLGKEIEKLKSKEKKPWPKVGDDYWFISDEGDSLHNSYGDAKSMYRLSTGNFRRTEKQALRHKEYITSPRVRARELVEICEGFDIHGRGVIALEFDGTPEAYMYEDIQPNGGFRFTDFDVAESALIKLGEPLIKVALGVIVGEEAERIVREYVGRGE